MDTGRKDGRSHIGAISILCYRKVEDRRLQLEGTSPRCSPGSDVLEEGLAAIYQGCKVENEGHSADIQIRLSLS